MIWYLPMIITLPFIMLLLAIVLDLGRITNVQGQLQTAVDAGALAAAQTAKHHQTSTLVNTGTPANPVLEEVVTWTLTIPDLNRASSAARSLIRSNTLLLPPSEGGIEYESFNVTRDTTVEIIGDDAVLVTAQARVNNVLINRLQQLYGENPVLVRVLGTAKAYTKN